MVRHMSRGAFEELQDGMLADLGADFSVGDVLLPAEPADILEHPALHKLPEYEPCLKHMKALLP